MTQTPVRPDTATDWSRCQGCSMLVYGKRLTAALGVCPHCAHHGRLTAEQWIELVLDPGSARPFGERVRPVDVLGFVDTKPYRRRLAEAQQRTGAADAVRCATGTVDGLPMVMAVVDFGFLGGSIGGAAGELITAAAERALRRRWPLLIVTASGGARMQEGTVSLMQLAKTAQAIGALHEAGVLCVNLNTHPTFGGATASFASLGDVVLAEPGALVGFAGPRVISQTIRQTLPPGFQTAESLHRTGMLDHVVPRDTLRPMLARLLRLHVRRPVDSAPVATRDERELPRQAVELSAAATVAVARHPDRPTAREYIAAVCDDFFELHGDRVGADDPAVIGGVARIDGRPVVVIGHQKGHGTADLIAHNFGMPEPAGYHKARRLMSYAARFAMPVVTLVDTPGAYPGVSAEERGQGSVIAHCIMEMSRLPVPTVAVIIGEGGSGGALALAAADRVLMLQHAVYSVISPEGCSSILFGTAERAAEAAQALRLCAVDLQRLGIVDGIVREPAGGAHTDPLRAAAALRDAVVAELRHLGTLTADELADTRYARFRRIGDPRCQPSLREEDAA